MLSIRLYISEYPKKKIVGLCWWFG